jgi:hypothetical protein
MNSRSFVIRASAVVLLLLVWTESCFGIASTDHLAGPGQRIPGQSKWPSGLETFVNDPARTDAWHGWFSELPNDVTEFQFRAADMAELNGLLDRFARIKSDKLQLLLSPDAPPERIGFGQPLAENQRQVAVFQIGNQQILDKWYTHLKQDADGRRVFGVHRYDRVPTALPPTLVIYTQHPAVDLEQLTIPANVEVQAGWLAPNADEATKVRHSTIEQVLKARQPAPEAKTGFLWDRRQPTAAAPRR